MLTLQKDKYGLGVSLDGAGSKLLFFHGGRNEGFDSYMVARAQTGQGLVIMINKNDNDKTLSEIINVIRREYGW